jgi:hypothetical protein
VPISNNPLPPVDLSVLERLDDEMEKPTPSGPATCSPVSVDNEDEDDCQTFTSVTQSSGP